MTEPVRRFPWVLTLLSLIAFGLLCGLGVWQVQRLQWKQGLIAAAAAAAALPPSRLDQLVLDGADPEFRRVIVDCPGLSSAPWVELRTIENGQAGVRLVSACPMMKDASSPWADVYLVDRGFVAETISARPPLGGSPQSEQIVAQARTTPAPGAMAPEPMGRQFFARDTQAMARALGVSGTVGPHTLYALQSSNPGWLALKPSAPPPTFSNNHLGYAITWFGLALALAGIYIALLRRKLAPEAASLGEQKDPS